MNAPASLILVRHGSCASLGDILLGRVVDQSLDNMGCSQAHAVGARLRRVRSPLVVASPRRRAQQTAAIIAKHLSAQVRTVAALDEMDFGSWSGREFSELHQEPAWRQWNEDRKISATPAGDSIDAVRHRALACVHCLLRMFPGRTVVAVTHAEIIRTLVLWWQGRSADDFTRVDVAPASLTAVDLRHCRAKVTCVNCLVRT